MTERDPSLDLALRLLVAEGVAEDEARWAKRTAAGISNWTGNTASRAELDALLVAPLPDGHDDGHQDEDLEEIEADSDSAASATEHLEQADRGYSISHPPASQAPTSIRSAAPPMSSSPPSGLEGLARLTRSGENSARIISAPPDDAGKAKGDDSGLIDLRAMSRSGETPAASEAPTAAAAPVIVGAPTATAPNVRPITASPPSSAIAPPSTMAAQVASAPQVSTPVAAAPKKKGGSVVWVAFGGLAAAAAVGVFVVTSSSSKTESTAATGAASTQSASKAASDDGEPKAKAKDPEAMASAATTATASPEESSSAAPDDTVALAPTTVGKKSYPMATSTAVGTGTSPPKTTATTKPSASVAEPPKPTPSGGSLDDVLGINKPPPAPTTTANTPDLPDKPEAADIRVAVNSKVGTANACVKGLDGPSSVSVVFSPAGTVTSVAVTSGPAKGTGAEACIKSAFTSAKVSRSKLGGTGYAKLLP